MDWNFRRSIFGCKILVELGVEQGLSADQCLQGTNIEMADLADPTAEVDGSQELAVVMNLIRLLPNSANIAFLAGLRYTLSSYGIWGYAMLSSPNLRSAIDVGLRFLHLTYAFNHLRTEEKDGVFRLTLDDSQIPPEARMFLVTRDAVGIYTAQKDMFGMPIPSKRIRVKHPKPDDSKPLRELFGVEVEYSAPENVVEIDAKWLDQPLPQANPVAWELCTQQCQALLAKRQSRLGLAGQIRTRLLQDPTNMPSMEDVAEEMNMTSRTLRRRLITENISYRQLLDEVRATLAEELLSTAGMPVEAIAHRLGYAETASFVHAFKRWKGVPPSRWRSARR